MIPYSTAKEGDILPMNIYQGRILGDGDGTKSRDKKKREIRCINGYGL